MARRWFRMADAAAVRAAPRPSGAGGRALAGLTRASDGAGLWLAVAAVLAAAGGPAGRRVAARALAALVATSAAVNGPAKLLARRPRPGRWATAGLRRAGRAPSTSSFPSGHTASAFAFAAAATTASPWFGAPLMATAAVVGWSRLHGAQHFPTDIAAGAAFGTAAGLATGWAFSRRERSAAARAAAPGEDAGVRRSAVPQANLVAPGS